MTVAGFSSTNNDASSKLHYLAIGSMMNPVSVRNRKLDLERTVRGQPAFLKDYKLVFFGAGFAEARYEKGAVLHGILYQDVSEGDMKVLDDLERDYFRQNVDVTVYPSLGDYKDESITKGVQNVGVYCRTPEQIRESAATDLPPSQRYLEIMLEGAKHFGVDKGFVEFLEKHPHRPRPTPSQYLTFPVQEGAMERTLAADHVEQNGNGVDGNPLYMRHNGRVVELTKDDGDEDAFFDEFVRYRKDHGIDIELFFAKLQYDPQYGIPKTMEEVTPQLAAYTEHNFCEYMNSNNLLHKWNVVAKIE